MAHQSTLPHQAVHLILNLLPLLSFKLALQSVFFLPTQAVAADNNIFNLLRLYDLALVDMNAPRIGQFGLFFAECQPALELLEKKLLRPHRHLYALPCKFAVWICVLLVEEICHVSFNRRVRKRDTPP